MKNRNDILVVLAKSRLLLEDCKPQPEIQPAAKRSFLLGWLALAVLILGAAFMHAQVRPEIVIAPPPGGPPPCTPAVNTDTVNNVCYYEKRQPPLMGSGYPVENPYQIVIHNALAKIWGCKVNYSSGCDSDAACQDKYITCVDNAQDMMLSEQDKILNNVHTAGCTGAYTAPQGSCELPTD